MLFVVGIGIVVAGLASQAVLMQRMGLLVLAIAAVLFGLQRLNAEMGGDDFRGPD